MPMEILDIKSQGGISEARVSCGATAAGGVRNTRWSDKSLFRSDGKGPGCVFDDIYTESTCVNRLHAGFMDI